MNYLLVESASKSYGDKLLFSNISFGLNKGQKLALLARNGSGKTSLLNCIAGLDKPDGGSVTVNRNITVGYLTQQIELDDKKSIMETIFHADTPVMNAIREYEEAVDAQAEANTEQNQQRLQKAMQQMDVLQAWDTEAKVKQILSKLDIPHNQHVGNLSGGQKKRLALAEVLIKEPDLLILDEPTNHLDIQMIEWLEQYLQQPNLSLLLVTHDRYFLDRITDEILELEDGELFRYKGNYEYFLEKKGEREHNRQSEVEKAQNLMRKELEWMRRMPKARTTKSKSRIDSFYDLETKAKQKTAPDEVNLQVKAQRLGSKILELHNINKNYGDLTILKNFTYSFKRGEKVGIIGKNGVGKTTFLNILIDQEKYDSGTMKTGETIQFGYFNQEGLELKEDKRVIEVVKDIADVIEMADGSKITASQLLYRFLFNRDMQYTYYSRLSGGEKRRLHLLTVLLKNPNFLILDEPTNDLDLQTLQVLEDFLEDYGGCVLVVSHDRYFMDKIVDHLFVFEGEGKVRDFPGNYTQYRNEVVEEEKATKKEASEAVKVEESHIKKGAPKEKKKLSFNEKYEFEQLEKQIPKLEARKKELSEALNSGESDHEKLIQWGAELQQVMDELEAKEMRWLELSEWM